MQAHEPKASRVDEVAIWARALNESEIQSRFKQDSISYEFLLANSTTFNLSDITASRIAINDYARQYWDEFTVFVENFDSLARIEANNGTINGNFSICEGRFGTGGCFDGGSGYVTIQDTDDLSFGDGTTDSPLTVEAWIEVSEIGRQRIVSKYDGSVNFEWFFSLDTDGTLYLYLRDESAAKYQYTTTDNALSSGWYHVAATYDGRGGDAAADGITIYVDAVSVASTATKQTGYVAMENLAGDVTIGSDTGGGSYFNGTIDEVRISKIARRPVSALWTLNYTLLSSEEMTSGVRHYWKVRALDGGGEQ